MSGQRYRLTTPTLAIAGTEERDYPVTKYTTRLLGSTAKLVPCGAVLTLIDGSLYGNRLVNVEWEGKIVMMFTADIRERCEQLADDPPPISIPN
jgi:hypothetical protein